MLITDTRFETDNPLHPVDNGLCPACESKAPEHRPPLQNSAYAAQHSALVDGEGLTEDEAHLRLLIRNGGYIASCEKCGTDFFVRVNEQWP